VIDILIDSLIKTRLITKIEEFSDNTLFGYCYFFFKKRASPIER
jgi:hypothetical protein